MILQLEDAAERIGRIYERRRKLGGFDANAEDFLVVCDVLLALLDYQIEMEEKANAKTRKR